MIRDAVFRGRARLQARAAGRGYTIVEMFVAMVMLAS